MSQWHQFILPILRFFRKRRGALILRRFPDIGRYRILDLGGSVHFWEETGLLDHVKSVKIYNISDGEIVINRPAGDKISVNFYDGMTIPEATASFDLVLCNSVLEHVPPAQRQHLAAEIRRVGINGFIQTPAMEFPIEPHFVLPAIHWLPRALGRYLVRISPWALLSKPSTLAQDAYWNEVRLLTRRDLAALFPRDSLSAERVLGIPKAWIITW